MSIEATVVNTVISAVSGAVVTAIGWVSHTLISSGLLAKIEAEKTKILTDAKNAVDSLKALATKDIETAKLDAQNLATKLTNDANLYKDKVVAEAVEIEAKYKTTATELALSIINQAKAEADKIIADAKAQVANAEAKVSADIKAEIPVVVTAVGDAITAQAEKSV